jgi:hypothetical protein
MLDALANAVTWIGHQIYRLVIVLAIWKDDSCK